MSTNHLDNLWRAIDKLPGRAAVAEEWRHLVGVTFQSIRPFLRLRQGRAESFFRVDSLPYTVVDHGEGDLVGVCPETGETLPLRAEQLLVYELDRRRLADAVAIALKIQRVPVSEEPHCLVTSIGKFRSSRQILYSCLIALPWEGSDVSVVSSQLIAEGHAPFLLFVPTRQWQRHHDERLLKTFGCQLIPLAETITLIGPGRLEAIEPLDTVLARASAQSDLLRPGKQNHNLFRQEGKLWTLTFAATTVRMTDSLGLRYLGHLIRHKGDKIDVLELTKSRPGQTVQPARGIEILDPQSRDEYQRQFDDLSCELEEARKFEDPARQQFLQEQMEHLSAQLSSAIGLGGGIRKEKDQVERTRISVKNAIDRALNRIGKNHVTLAQHIGKSLRTGLTLSYDPYPDVVWEL